MLIDNKKTREISWNDFVLSGNKENLINQGWESFEPYGNEGKETRAPLEVFEEGYAKNILPEKFEEFIIEVPIEKNFISNSYDVSSYKGDSVSITSKYGSKTTYSEVSVGLYNNTTNKWAQGPVIYPIIDGVMVSGLFEVPNDSDRYSIYEYFGRNGQTGGQTGHIIDRGVFLNGMTSKIYERWEDIPEKDKPVRAWDNMAVHFTPLGNGLTRIQTWGGNNKIKLLSNTGTSNMPLNYSLYVEKAFKNMYVTPRYAKRTFVEEGKSSYSSETTVPNPPGNDFFMRIDTPEVSDNLDFIASDPQIVEGDVPNAVMVVDTLEDGRKHVQVHNVNENTKLVYTGGGVIKGEPYTLETEIENDGRIFNLSANMLDDKIEVQKGMNDIRKSGELQDKELKIEIGVD